MPSSFTFVLLPTELLDIIASHSSKKELKNLRLVHRRFSEFYEIMLFSSVTLRSYSKQSYINYQALQESRLNPYVRKFTVITARQPDLPRHRFDELLPLSEDSESYYPEVDKDWLRGIREVGKFVNLEAVKVHFSCDAAADDDGETWLPPDWPPRESASERFAVLRRLIWGLEHVEFPTPHLKSLTIKNLQDINNRRIVNSKKFKALLGRIEELRLLIVHEEDDNDPRWTSERDELHTFFEELPKTWLAHCKNLKRLTIHSQHTWGYYPKVDWRGLELPNLTFLELGNYSFAQDRHIDWVCSIKSLRELVLDSCHIVSKSQANGMDKDGVVDRLSYGDNSRLWVNPTRWRHYFTKIGEQLPNLSEMRFGKGYWSEGQNFEEGLVGWDEKRENGVAYNRKYAYNHGPELGLYKSRYMQFYYKDSPTPWKQFSWNPVDDDCGTEKEERLDRRALKNLQKLVRQRAIETRWISSSTTSDDWRDAWRSDFECPGYRPDFEESEDWNPKMIEIVEVAEIV